MQIEQWPIDRVRPYEKNPRVNEHAVEAVAHSLLEFGFRQPIVVDENGVIIVGHTRWKAAQKLGMETVPVHVATGLSKAQIKAYRIADNQTATLAEWDQELLPLELAELREMNFDLALTGFFEDEIAEWLGDEVQEGLTDPDEVPEPPDEAITQTGDLWILGDHRLLCGDSSKAEDVDRLLNGQSIHLVNTDPPYNVRVEPRSNNAIAAGLSSFAAPEGHRRKTATHHQGLDLRGIPRSRNLRGKNSGPKTGRWPTTSSRTRSSTPCSMLGSETSFAYCYRVAASISGAAMPTLATIRPSSKNMDCTSLKALFGTNSILC